MQAIPRPDIDTRPLAERAAEALEAKNRATDLEDQTRLAATIEDVTNNGRLAIARLTEVADTAVEMGTPRFGDDITRAQDVEGTVDGIVFRYVKERGAGYSKSTVFLVRQCQRCTREDLTDVRFLWQIGDVLAGPTHPQGCPTEALPEPVAALLRQRRVMSAAEEQLIEGVLGVVREHGGFASNE